jgi:hypothetical protein
MRLKPFYIAIINPNRYIDLATRYITLKDAKKLLKDTDVYVFRTFTTKNLRVNYPLDLHYSSNKINNLWYNKSSIY